eukprot:NODE_656_length_1424_cov_285.200146.p1 GENE.NODE_656_length_1424_cov_285.200146~~NODE_656_length_1424_cov_285.200146.p1  ORF type:complete len:237 (+),score=71.30 NODE_656_length_1424_cov_285.200146:3-713(+)
MGGSSHLAQALFGGQPLQTVCAALCGAMGAKCTTICSDPPVADPKLGRLQGSYSSNLTAGAGSDKEVVAGMQVAETEAEMTIKPRGLHDKAEEYADTIFASLVGDMGAETFEALEVETASYPLSKDRAKVVLRSTADMRMTCEQMNGLFKFVTLEAAKEEIMYERYGHLHNREDFKSVVLHPLTRSEAMRMLILDKLVERLNEAAKKKEAATFEVLLAPADLAERERLGDQPEQAS